MLNRRITLSLFALPAGVLFCVSAAACGGTLAVNPTATATRGSVTAVNSSSAVSTPASPTNSLASASPCALLSQSDLAQLKVVVSGEPSNVGTARGCQWNTADATLSLDVRTNAGLSDVQSKGAPVTSLPVGHHQAKKSDEQGGCFVFLGVGTGERVDVSGVGNTGSDCSLAMRAAKLVEQNLPKS